MGNFKEEIAAVRAFVFDVDGVFTDGGIMPLSDGDFVRRYNTKDGYAVARAVAAGYKVCIISAGRGRALELRFADLGVTKIYVDRPEKTGALAEFMREHSLAPREVMAMGDDVPDIAIMRAAGVPVCPRDAVPEVVEASHYVSQFPGGAGCVRDVIEQVMRARGDW